VHRRAGEPERPIDLAAAADRAAKDELAVCVPSVQDTQRLVDPPREVVGELGDTRNGGAGVDESESVVVLTAAVREYSRVITATEQAPDRDRAVFGARLRDQLVRVAFDKLLRMQLYRVCVLICQCSSGRRATLATQKGHPRGENVTCAEHAPA
jgi:hypothetical protein